MEKKKLKKPHGSPNMSQQNPKKSNVGKLLCGGFQGTGVTSQAYNLIVKHKISTMIVSKKNAVSVKQMTKLIRDLQYIAFSEAHYKYPLMFAIDEEGGMMNALFDADFLTQFPGAMALSASGDIDLVYQVLKALAVELKTIGFLIIFGPVLDVVTKLSHQLVGVRSFGTTVEEVIKNGKACAKGFQDGGLFCFGKHFPGIGNASVDSLLELPMLPDSLDQVRHFNAVPFGELIKANSLDGISAAGCGVPTISPDEVHACLSPVVVNQLLRTELNFNGVVISECLEMDALHHSVGLGQGVILALYAGCDLILVCHDPKLQDEAVDSMEKALANGNLDEESVNTSLRRIEVLQKKLPTWQELFPRGETSAKEDKIELFRDKNPELWEKHQKISDMAYRKSVTLVRDYPDVLPLSKFLGSSKRNKNGKTDKTNNILLLTPLLNPITGTNDNSDSKLYNGEEVFQRFGNMLSDHHLNKELENPYQVLHTTYTANGLTSLHETLIENSKVVIVLTSEASRNMYQIGIVKYVSILCGASPSSFNSSGQTYSQLSKPLVLVATSSPYDFFYNKSIGSAYLCCYDYTDNVLRHLVDVLMGDYVPDGCIPGEKKYVSRLKKRRLTDSHNNDPKAISRKNSIPRRRWLVDEFDMKRDWASLVTLIKNNNDEGTEASDVAYNSYGRAAFINYQDDKFFEKLYLLLSDPSQKQFVVRNSSLNILYGIIITWVNDSLNFPLDGGVMREPSDPNFNKIGSILYILVDKTKRLQSIGKNLHVRAMRYLIKEKSCNSLTLGSSFPLIVLPGNSNLVGSNANSKVLTFMENFGWNVSVNKLRKKHIMLLKDLKTWLVPKKIFKELMIVGIRFDLCTDPEKLMNLLGKTKRGKLKPKSDDDDEEEDDEDDEEDNEQGDEEEEEEDEEDHNDNNSNVDGKSGTKKDSISRKQMVKEEKENIKEIYLEAIKHLDSSNGVKIIIALEPTHQNVIGSIILFTNKSQLAKFFPYIDEASLFEVSSAKDSPVSNRSDNEELIGGIVAPVIDSSYSNLTEIFKYGLICSGITLLKSSFNEDLNKCLMVGVNEDQSGNMNGIKDIGFQEWKYYYDYYEKKSSRDFES